MRDADSDIDVETIRRVKSKRRAKLPPTPTEGITIHDFIAYLPEHAYVYVPTRQIWPAASVNAVVPPIGNGKDATLASSWLDQNRAAAAMTWFPGQGLEIKDRIVAEGGWLVQPGVMTINLYRPPCIAHTPGDVSLWLDHIKLLYGEEATNHLIRWMAHRVQRPHEKINHAIVLGGGQGIGKDSILEPLRSAVGDWNFSEVSPQQVLGRFNSYLKSTVLRISEARDLGDSDRFAFYDHCKSFIASPPSTLRIDEKHRAEYYLINTTAVVVTTNHRDGIYLPEDDRRHFCCWSEKTKEEFSEDYFNRLWRFIGHGGREAVAQFLATRDLSSFNPKKPPPKTEAFHQTVNTNRSSVDAELADALDAAGSIGEDGEPIRPDVVTIAKLVATVDTSNASFSEFLRDRRNAKVVNHRLEACGYTVVRNPDAADGLWRINGRRQAVYGRVDRSPQERLDAAKGVGRQWCQ